SLPRRSASGALMARVLCKELGVLRKERGVLRKEPGVLRKELGSPREELGVLRKELGSSSQRTQSPSKRTQGSFAKSSESFAKNSGVPSMRLRVKPGKSARARPFLPPPTPDTPLPRQTDPIEISSLLRTVWPFAITRSSSASAV